MVSGETHHFAELIRKSEDETPRRRSNQKKFKMKSLNDWEKKEDYGIAINSTVHVSHFARSLVEIINGSSMWWIRCLRLLSSFDFSILSSRFCTCRMGHTLAEKINLIMWLNFNHSFNRQSSPRSVNADTHGTVCICEVRYISDFKFILNRFDTAYRVEAAVIQTW